MPEPTGVEDGVSQYLGSKGCVITEADKNNTVVFRVISEIEPFNWAQLAVSENPQRQLRPLEVDANKNIYEGEWIGDKKDGRGIQVLSNGTRYDGFWANNVY